MIVAHLINTSLCHYTNYKPLKSQLENLAQFIFALDSNKEKIQLWHKCQRLLEINWAWHKRACMAIFLTNGLYLAFFSMFQRKLDSFSLKISKYLPIIWAFCLKNVRENLAQQNQRKKINPKAAHQSKNDGCAKFQFMFVLCNTAKINWEVAQTVIFPHF